MSEVIKALFESIGDKKYVQKVKAYRLRVDWDKVESKLGYSKSSKFQETAHIRRKHTTSYRDRDRAPREEEKYRKRNNYSFYEKRISASENPDVEDATKICVPSKGMTMQNSKYYANQTMPLQRNSLINQAKEHNMWTAEAQKRYGKNLYRK